MKTHLLKLKPEYALAKLLGIKTFEIRLNDRDFHLDDCVMYSCPDDVFLNFALKSRVYCITYICDYAQKDGYIVFFDKIVL